MASSIQLKTAERLQDNEYRREYGAVSIKYDLALALVEARKAYNLTQSQVAQQCNVTQAYIAKLESGEANPTIGHIGGLLASMWWRLHFHVDPLLEDPSREEPGPSRIEDDVLSVYRANAPSDATTFNIHHPTFNQNWAAS